jgi:hypothetical protein
VPHHSANHYNLAVSFRLSWIQQFKILFFIPVTIAGFHPMIFFVVNQVAVLFQFWVHTEYIKKLPRWIEYIFATPSNHRVHHGSQEKYLDRNYGATFIIWDRMFGTFYPEEERPIYGLTTPVHSGNPFFLVFHEAIDIVNDVRKAKTWKERFWYIFGSPVEIAAAKRNAAKKEVKGGCLIIARREVIPGKFFFVLSCNSDDAFYTFLNTRFPPISKILCSMPARNRSEWFRAGGK